jgi:hypothetical protein
MKNQTLAKENTVEMRKNGTKIEYLKFCYTCGTYFVSTRPDRLTCDTGCKQRLTLRMKKGLSPLVERTMRDKPTKELLQSLGFENNQK